MARKPLTYEIRCLSCCATATSTNSTVAKPRREMRSHRCDFRHLDLRGLEANGIDFSKARLKAQASRARGISGGFFATELSAAEVALSIQHGARQRYRK